MLAEFGALDVHLISQSSNNLNLTFVVDEALADELMPRLHALLIRADALRVEDGAVFGPSWRALADEAVAPKRDDWWRHRRDAWSRSRARHRRATCIRLIRSGDRRGRCHRFRLSLRERPAAGRVRAQADASWTAGSTH